MLNVENDVYQTIGPFRLLKCGSLLLGEIGWMMSTNTRKTDSLKAVYRAAETIAEGEQLPIKTALKVVQNPADEAHQSIALRYFAVFQEIEKNRYTEQDARHDLALMMLNSRIDKTQLNNKNLFVDAFGMKFEGDAITSLGDKFPGDLIGEIIDFIAMEQSGQ